MAVATPLCSDSVTPSSLTAVTTYLVWVRFWFCATVGVAVTPVGTAAGGANETVLSVQDVAAWRASSRVA